MNAIRKHLGWKLFLSYLIIILVGIVSLTVAAEIHTPTALNRHMAQMDMMMGANSGMITDINASFISALNEVLLVAASLAVVAAVIVSTFVTRRIIRPIQQMTDASQRIATGRYEERVLVSGEDELAGLAQSFNQMAHTLATTEERRRQLIGDVAHELRTPLSSIRSVLEGMQDGVVPTAPAALSDIQREVGRLQRLVSDLEELSRAEAGQIALDFALTPPQEFIQPAIERLRLQFVDKEVALHLALDEALPAVRVDKGRMTQVLLNLLGNALQYTPTGGQVTVRTSKDVANIIVEVQDTGVGLAADDLALVFERFYRVDKSRSRAGGGSGIGLTISKRLVELHHGTLVASSPGLDLGSTFTVTLPLPL